MSMKIEVNRKTEAGETRHNLVVDGEVVGWAVKNPRDRTYSAYALPDWWSHGQAALVGTGMSNVKEALTEVVIQLEDDDIWSAYRDTFL